MLYIMQIGANIGDPMLQLLVVQNPIDRINECLQQSMAGSFEIILRHLHFQLTADTCTLCRELLSA